MPQIKNKNRKMSTCNQLDLETHGFIDQLCLKISPMDTYKEKWVWTHRERDMSIYDDLAFCSSRQWQYHFISFFFVLCSFLFFSFFFCRFPRALPLSFWQIGNDRYPPHFVTCELSIQWTEKATLEQPFVSNFIHLMCPHNKLTDTSRF